MSTLALLGAIAVFVVVIPLSVVLLRFNRKRLIIVRAAAAASASQLEHIYMLVERTGTVAVNGYVLARTNRRSDDSRCLIPIPTGLPKFPWAGKAVLVTTSSEVQFQFVDAAAVEPSLLGHVYRAVQVPRHQSHGSAKARNTFAPQKYVASSENLHAALKEVCPAYPTDLLSYLLCVGRANFEFEPIDQARIGTSPAWVQDPDHPVCKECGKRMALVLQMPGTTISKKAFQRGTFYLFGCVDHPDQTKSLGQFT
jgi:hypothetical protein